MSKEPPSGRIAGAANPAAAAYARAGAAFNAGRIAETEALLRDTLRLDPNHADAYNRLGFLCARRGDGAAALENLRKAVALNPGSAEFASNLGSAELKFGDAETAAEALERAVALNPSLPQTHFNLGLVFQKLDRHDRAVLCFQKALALRPALTEALLALGESLRKSGRNNEAVAAYRQLVALMPKAAAARLHLARALETAGQFDEAATAVREVLALEPNNATAYKLLASCLMLADRTDEAIASARESLRLKPDDYLAHNLMAACLWAEKRTEEAAAAAQEALRVNPDNAYAHDILARHHLAGGRIEEAEASARCALNLDSNYPEAHNTLGMVMATLGRSTEAVACFQAALALDPNLPESIYHLVLASKDHATPALAARIDNLLASGKRPSHKALLHFALGHICEESGDYARAFENFRAAKAIRGLKSAFDAGEWNANIDRLTAVYTRGFFTGRAGFGSDEQRPIFIVGMPRSGTTLVEQILVSHPDIVAGGELPALPELVNSLSQRIHTGRRYPEAVRDLTGETAKALASDYLAALDAIDPRSARVTDKLPQNFLNLGLIALVLPHAAVIHCRRDPLDTCLSCFFTNFLEDLDYTYRLEDLGEYYLGYQRLMAHWRKTLPLRMLEVEYEDLIANQEDVSRRLVAHCGLEWDDRCLQFHETERAVATASVWQVRQPIYGSSVKRWRRYEPLLGPLIEALERDPV